MIIRIEQQLKDSIQNQNQIMRDLKDLFQGLEKESKLATAICSDLKGHVENSQYRWYELDKKITNINEKIRDNEKSISDFSDEVSDEKNSLKQLINDEKLDREKFEQSILSSLKAARFMINILAGIATILSVIALLSSFMKG